MVAIAGILVAVAAVNLFPSDAEVARREAAEVALAVEHARDAAWFGGRPVAITVADGRVREWRLRGSAWSLDPARDRALPPDLRVASLYVDGEPMAPGERLVFLPDGLGVPFRLALEVRGITWGVQGDPAGAIALAP